MTDKPNIVVIVADDLGYGDVGFHGSDIQTPNLDRLVSEGVSLEQFYVAPVCSPTRAGLMTGRYPIRFGMMRSVIPPQRNFGMDTNEDTLAQMLARAGYEHRVCIGKWHLGHAQKKWHPTRRGFTQFVGCYNGAIDYFTHERNGELDFHRNDDSYRIEGYSTDIFANESVEFLDSVPSGEPYFLYVPFNAPHGPIQAKEEDIAKYGHREGDKQIYAAMVDCMDQGIGRILEAIERRGETENTLVLFFSDNGGVARIASNGSQRGAKTTPYQGGIRVAAAARWPKGGIEGGKTIHTRMGYIDMMPTIKEAIGLEEEAKNPFDGLSVLNAIRGEETLPDRSWFTYYDQDSPENEKLAVNYDQSKLVVHRPAPDGDRSKPAEIELFAIQEDSQEADNRVALEGEKSEELLSEIDQFLSLKPKTQIARFREGAREFQAPEEWRIDE